MLHKKHALLIGINQYYRISHLKYAVNDAEAVAKVLQDRYDFAPDEITLMTCQKQNIFHPTQNNIEAQLLNLRKIDDLELLIVGFWGHGIMSMESQSTGRYLCAIDTRDSELVKTGISLRALNSYLKQAGAVDTCLILDCYQTQAVGRKAGADVLTPNDMEQIAQETRDVDAAAKQKGARRPPTMITLNSCSLGQRAFEWDAEEHGVFTFHLLEIMQRDTSVKNWAPYISTAVQQTVRSFGWDQKPYSESKGGGDISLFLQKIPEPDDTPSEIKRRAEAEAASVIPQDVAKRLGLSPDRTEASGGSGRRRVQSLVPKIDQPLRRDTDRGRQVAHDGNDLP